MSNGLNVAFIGLGRMGRGMAQRILGGGHHLVVQGTRQSRMAGHAVEQL